MAIAVSSTANLGATNPGTSHTVAFNNVSGNILFVGAICTGGNVITGVTYNGVAMTQVTGSPVQSPSANYHYLFYLLSPATGSNNVVISASASVYIGGTAVSYSGAVNGIDVSGNTTVTSQTSIAKSLTTTFDNDWCIAYAGTNGAAISAGTSTTLRQAGDAANRAIFDSNGVVTPPGSRTLTATFTSDNSGMIMAAFGGTTVESGAPIIFNFI